jgi:type II secretory pathway component PulJ
MTSGFRLGIRAKLTVAISILALGFAAFFSIYFPIQQGQIASGLLESRSVSLTRVLGTLSEASMVALDVGGAETLARSESQNAALLVSAIMFLVGLAFAWLIGRTVAMPVRDVALDLDRVAL